METEQTNSTTTDHYLTTLKREFAKKQRASRTYSLRAFARHLGIPASSLALILKNKRPFPVAAAGKVCQKLNLSPRETQLFHQSVQLRRANLTTLTELKLPKVGVVLDEEAYFRVIAEWEHYAVLHLLDTRDFIANSTSVSDRLCITETRASDVLENLLNCGLLVADKNAQFSKTHAHVRTTEDILSPALRKSHKEALEMGLEKLETVSMDLRDYSSMTLAIDPSRLPHFKKLIREFRQKLTTFSEEGDLQEVYQFCFQMYPLTKIKKENL